MARVRPGVGTLLAVLAVGCHGWHRGVLVVEPPAAAGAATVTGDVEQPLVLPVPPGGVSLRAAVAAVRVKGNAAEANPGSTYALVVRPEADYYVALALVNGGGADDIRVRPTDAVRVVAWENTDLARGLAEVPVAATALRPAADDDLAAVTKWLRELFPNKAFDVEAAAVTTKDGFERAAKEYFDTLEDELRPFTHAKPQLTPADNADEATRRAWLKSALVPYFAKVAESRLTPFNADGRVRRYTPDWRYLADLYRDRPRVGAGAAELAAITAEFLAPGDTNVIAADLLTVTPPTSKRPGGHPTFGTYFALLTAIPDPGVVRVVRTVGGRRTEFIQELIPSSANWGVSGRNREQDFARQRAMLVFDGDVVEVTTLGRVPPVLEAAVLNVLESRRR